MTRHRFDTFSAIAGVACLGLAAVVVFRTGPVGLASLRLVVPLVVLALGISLLASGGRAARTEPATVLDGAADDDLEDAPPHDEGRRDRG